MWKRLTEKYDLLEWRDESGAGLGKPQKTSVQTIDFFQLVRAAAFASILAIIKPEVWQSQIAPRAFAEWLARVVRDGAAINANVILAKAARAIVAYPIHAELLIHRTRLSASLCANPERGRPIAFASKPSSSPASGSTRIPLASTSPAGPVSRGSSVKSRRRLSRSLLNVGADSTLA